MIKVENQEIAYNAIVGVFALAGAPFIIAAEMVYAAVLQWISDMYDAGMLQVLHIVVHHG